MTYTVIEKVVGREILDSRGNPTVEAEIYLADGTVARAPLPAVHQQANLKHSSCVTAISQDTAARA